MFYGMEQTKLPFHVEAKNILKCRVYNIVHAVLKSFNFVHLKRCIAKAI